MGGAPTNGESDSDSGLLSRLFSSESSTDRDAVYDDLFGDGSTNGSTTTAVKNGTADMADDGSDGDVTFNATSDTVVIQSTNTTVNFDL